MIKPVIPYQRIKLKHLTPVSSTNKGWLAIKALDGQKHSHCGLNISQHPLQPMTPPPPFSPPISAIIVGERIVSMSVKWNGKLFRLCCRSGLCCPDKHKHSMPGVLNDAIWEHVHACVCVSTIPTAFPVRAFSISSRQPNKVKGS